MDEKKFPKPEDIHKEFEDFVQKKFGGQVQVITHQIPLANVHEKNKNNKIDGETSKMDSFELSFDWKPQELKNYLDRFVIKQDEAKKALAIAVCDHYNQVHFHHAKPQTAEKQDYVKQNVLILGPTGVGKTYMVKQIAKLIGVPFVKADATRFSETGYMGANVEDLVKDLVSQAQGDVQKAQYGIVYLDEADKLATSSRGAGRDVSGRGVQLGLLKLMEETDIDLRASHDPASQLQAFMELQQKGKIERQMINTRYILFIVSGAFTGLEAIIGKRLTKKRIGFLSDEDQETQSEDTLLKYAATQDFVDFGFEPEFIGRMPVRVACEHLSASDLFKILKDSAGTIVFQYIQAFKAYGIDIRFTDDALQEIANLAFKEKTGARGLMTVCEKVLRDYKFYLPSTDLVSLEITSQMILDPKGELKKLLRKVKDDQVKEKKQIAAFERSFKEKHGMEILFNEDAIDLICERSIADKMSADKFCEILLHSYEYGLKLIQQNTGKTQFLFGKNVVLDPKASLEKMIRESYLELSDGLSKPE